MLAGAVYSHARPASPFGARRVRRHAQPGCQNSHVRTLHNARRGPTPPASREPRTPQAPVRSMQFAWQAIREFRDAAAAAYTAVPFEDGAWPALWLVPSLLCALELLDAEELPWHQKAGRGVRAVFGVMRRGCPEFGGMALAARMSRNTPHFAMDQAGGSGLHSPPVPGPSRRWVAKVSASCVPLRSVARRRWRGPSPSSCWRRLVARRPRPQGRPVVRLLGRMAPVAERVHRMARVRMRLFGCGSCSRTGLTWSGRSAVWLGGVRGAQVAVEHGGAHGRGMGRCLPRFVGICRFRPTSARNRQIWNASLGRQGVPNLSIG